MNHIEILPPSADMVLHVAENLRSADVAEIKAGFGEDVDVVKSVFNGYQKSEWMRIGCLNREPTAIFGYVRQTDRVGLPWMLATNRFREGAFQSAPLWKPHLEHMQEQCPILMNYVHSENRQAILWLKYMGFTILPKLPVKNSYFHPFIRTKKCVTPQPSR